MEQGTLPDSAVLADFVALSQIMTSYPGFGDDHYDAYTKACLTFNKACRKNELREAQETFKSIMQIKHDCHHIR